MASQIVLLVERLKSTFAGTSTKQASEALDAIDQHLDEIVSSAEVGEFRYSFQDASARPFYRLFVF